MVRESEGLKAPQRLPYTRALQQDSLSMNSQSLHSRRISLLNRSLTARWPIICWWVSTVVRAGEK